MNDTRRPNLWEWGLLGISLVLFVMLTIGITTHAQWVISLDRLIIRAVRFPQTPWKNLIVSWYTTFFNPVPLIIFILAGTLILFIEHYYRAMFFFLFTPVLGTILNSVIKALVKRPRPSFDPLMHYGGYSFPSGHSSGAVLVLGCVMILISSFMIKRQRCYVINIVIFIFILLVGYSRIYVGVHYPSDVLAGFCLGYIVVFVGQTVFGYHHSPRHHQL
jgi:Membrane-associated phospholipid phosphatase